MRISLVSLAAVVFVGLAGAALAADRHMFIIGNDADGYGVDRCLAGGEKCGAPAANAYCRTQKFAPRRLLPQGRPQRDHRRHSARRVERLPRRQVRELRRHRLHALILLSFRGPEGREPGTYCLTEL